MKKMSARRKRLRDKILAMSPEERKAHTLKSVKELRETMAAVSDVQNIHDAEIMGHYANARIKHPYFADAVMHHIWNARAVKANLARLRKCIKQDAERHTLEALALLVCEMREFEEAMTIGDTKQAVEELYDMIAVCLRMVDALEGRQKLGKPEEGAAQ